MEEPFDLGVPSRLRVSLPTPLFVPSRLYPLPLRPCPSTSSVPFSLRDPLPALFLFPSLVHPRPVPFLGPQS